MTILSLLPLISRDSPQQSRYGVRGTPLSIIGGMKQESVTDGEPHAMSLLAERLSDR
jgi:hypothetical protein